jgi:thymidylate kinase
LVRDPGEAGTVYHRLARPTLVIVTGQKGAGKSTMCDELLDGFQSRGVHAVVIHGQRFGDYENVVSRDTFFRITVAEELAMAQSLLRLGGVVIFDRFLVTDLVFGSTSFSLVADAVRQVHELVRGVRDVEVWVVNVSAPADEIATRVHNRDGELLESSVAYRHELSEQYALAGRAVAGMLQGVYLSLHNDTAREALEVLRSFVDRMMEEATDAQAPGF